MLSTLFLITNGSKVESGIIPRGYKCLRGTKKAKSKKNWIMQVTNHFSWDEVGYVFLVSVYVCAISGGYHQTWKIPVVQNRLVFRWWNWMRSTKKGRKYRKQKVTESKGNSGDTALPDQAYPRGFYFFALCALFRRVLSNVKDSAAHNGVVFRWCNRVRIAQKGKMPGRWEFQKQVAL